MSFAGDIHQGQITEFVTQYKWIKGMSVQSRESFSETMKSGCLTPTFSSILQVSFHSETSTDLLLTHFAELHSMFDLLHFVQPVLDHLLNISLDIFHLSLNITRGNQKPELKLKSKGCQRF